MIVKKLYRDEKGAAAVLLSVFMLVLLALAGLVLDGGLLMYSRTRLEAAAEAAAMATIKAYDKELWEKEGIVEINPIEAENYAKQYLELNLAKAQIEDVRVNPLKKNEVIVTAKLEVEMVFMRGFGIEKKVVRTTVKSIIS